MVLRVREVVRRRARRPASLEDVEQTAGLASDKCRGVAGADGEDRGVRHARPPGAATWRPGPELAVSAEFECDRIAVGLDNRARVELPSSDVVEVRLDGAIDSGTYRAVESRRAWVEMSHAVSGTSTEPAAHRRASRRQSRR